MITEPFSGCALKEGRVDGREIGGGGATGRV